MRKDREGGCHFYNYLLQQSKSLYGVLGVGGADDVGGLFLTGNWCYI